MRTVILIYLLMVGMSILFTLGIVYFIIWIFNLGEYPRLDEVTTLVGIYIGIVFILNLLFGFRIGKYE